MKEIKIPFICKAPNRDKVEIEMSYIDYKISGDNIILNIKLNMKFCNNNSSNVKIIEDIKINENLFLEDYNVVVYIIKKDDSIWSIAKKFNVTIDSIIRVNNLENPSMIYPGDKLYILR